MTHIFDTLKIFLVSSALRAYLIFLLQYPFQRREVLQNLLKWLPAVNSDSLLQTMLGAVNLPIKQYEDSQLSILNHGPEFSAHNSYICDFLLQTMLGVADLCIK